MSKENGSRKLSIICSKGSLDMAYPGLALANAALMEGIDVTMFFTFWGLDMVNKKKMTHLKATPVGNPSMGMPNLVGILPGVTDMATVMMKLEKADLCEEIDGVIGAMEFMEMSEGAQVIFI